ncbi:hypothetical protein CFIMG_003065RAa [Ceratocystis fimbriata CBS 114723]|uniref:Uncharacterized protein n=1 Tax=Ceratocystis fimbriata CBS 114723 TaxID=1035309 RepID=A0A2C5XD51_9PEZI|nr:hypothetical protein CFIMG_003065RAa [Ceratocystis fimbriata CBS 114723]
MPVHLDIPATSHPKIMVSPPKINLRRAAAYKERGPLSASSSRFNFNHLLFSPPPSPGLPALVPRPRKVSRTPRPSQIVRMLGWICCGMTMCYLTILLMADRADSFPVLVMPSWVRQEFEMVGLDDVPDFSTPIVVTDQHGRSRWTVSIPPTAEFPLSFGEYKTMAETCREVATRARDLHSTDEAISAMVQNQNLLDFAKKDSYFIDVQDAENTGLLPAPEARDQKISSEAKGNLVGVVDDATTVKLPICERSMTVTLESSDAGLGQSLMMLWTFYGLAQKQGRSFFIDDSRWAYGKYTNMFEAPPRNNCRPPPRHHMLPCPLQARHLVISPATAHENLMGMLSVSSLSFKSKDGSKVLYSLARAGHDALFKPIEQDKKYIASRAEEVRRDAQKKNGVNGPVVGIHIRHGDRHPLEYQYHESYVPLNIFSDRAFELADKHHNATHSANSDGSASSPVPAPLMVVATDDPVVFDNEEFKGALRAQDHIRLASKSAPQQVSQNRMALHRFVDETIGWEGGFYAPMFWSLGQPPSATGKVSNLVNRDPTTLSPSVETLRLRNYLGRAYLMDLSVLVESGDYVMCTVSAMGCRMLAVMMGWERAFERERWVNLDGDFTWSGLNRDLDL